MKILGLTVLVFGLLFSAAAQTLEPEMQAVVDLQIQRLQSSDAETRRDAVQKLVLLENAVAARAALDALNDSSEIVRAVACKAAAVLPDEEAAAFLIPFLKPKNEKSEFVRREAASALGRAASKNAVPDLISSLQTDKTPSVRAASAIALGNIADERAIDSLTRILRLPDTKKIRKSVDEFVRRSAARALGEIRNKKAVPVLIEVLRDVKNSDDIRREAAFALGTIADDSAAEVLRENLNAKDYLLAEIAAEGLQKIADAQILKQSPLFN